MKCLIYGLMLDSVTRLPITSMMSAETTLTLVFLRTHWRRPCPTGLTKFLHPRTLIRDGMGLRTIPSMVAMGWSILRPTEEIKAIAIFTWSPRLKLPTFWVQLFIGL